MAYSHEMLIDQETGEFDRAAINAWALTRAQADFGGPNPPDRRVRSELLRLQDTAAIMRRRWRAAHGLPDDTETTMMAIPGWSGDGLCREA